MQTTKPHQMNSLQSASSSLNVYVGVSFSKNYEIPMRISDEHMNEFIRLYEEKHGIKLEYPEAYDKASRLLRLVEIVESNSVPKSQ